ncbi:hypothetical protein VP01_4772g1 [Puccinia sorghi]|uniref:Uncharacterized protein n=1 Tax=Puccinia sorghi TaxID=27349 RepID=A0A0L6UMR3_9BASI|nr:hypothetical protein VP01_4772g1 [Puccinia sorghi]
MPAQTPKTKPRPPPPLTKVCSFWLTKEKVNPLSQTKALKILSFVYFGLPQLSAYIMPSAAATAEARSYRLDYKDSTSAPVLNPFPSNSLSLIMHPAKCVHCAWLRQQIFLSLRRLTQSVSRTTIIAVYCSGPNDAKNQWSKPGSQSVPALHPNQRCLAKPHHHPPLLLPHQLHPLHPRHLLLHHQYYLEGHVWYHGVRILCAEIDLQRIREWIIQCVHGLSCSSEVIKEWFFHGTPHPLDKKSHHMAYCDPSAGLGHRHLEWYKYWWPWWKRKTSTRLSEANGKGNIKRKRRERKKQVDKSKETGDFFLNCGWGVESLYGRGCWGLAGEGGKVNLWTEVLRWPGCQDRIYLRELVFSSLIGSNSRIHAIGSLKIKIFFIH